MTTGEIALLVGLLFNAAAVFFGLRAQKVKLDNIQIDIKTVEHATNSMQDRLEAAAHAAGKEEERVDQSGRSTTANRLEKAAHAAGKEAQRIADKPKRRKT